MLADKSNALETFAISSFLYSKLTEDGEYSYNRVRRWTKRIPRLFASDILFLPVNLNATHWALVTIFMRRRLIVFLDSLQQATGEDAEMEVVSNVRQWLLDEAAKRGNAIDGAIGKFWRLRIRSKKTGMTVGSSS